eukprot:TRINITY_DN4405_c0_g1_i1.p2 TRINITY_DN4405_c0_g1~~TRINITY_DN4405_c0_g1_i1.p2  ORF type:complete len:156 (+),score=43.94 TRINITY_DN4405_c0_g1_i1:725-1192(+)
MLSTEQTGTIAVITQGIGVVLFLDLVAYLLRLNIHKVSTTNKTQCKLYEDENFSKLNSKSFKLVLVACFKEQGQVIGQAMCQALYEISGKYNINNFEYHLKFAKTDELAWAEETLKKCVPAKAKKIFIMGNYKIEEAFREILRKIGIKERQIYCI